MAINLSCKLFKFSNLVFKTKYVAPKFVYSTHVEIKAINSSTEPDDPPPAQKVPKDIQKYFDAENKSEMLDLIPLKYLKKKQKPSEHLYLTDKTVAGTIASHVRKRCTTSIVVEVNPGMGMLTEELLKFNNLQKLYLCESNECFIKNLETFKAKNKDVIVKKSDIINLYKLVFQDKLDNKERVSELLNGLPKKRWDERK